MRQLDINAHDTTIGLWQERADDPTFRDEVYKGVIALLRRHGWKVKPDKSVHRSIARDFRLADKGPMHCAIHLSGRVVTLEFWSTGWKNENRHGHRYDFDKLGRMPFLDRMRFERTFVILMDWLRTVAELSGDCGPRGSIFRLPTPDERIATQYAKDWHKDRELGYPVPRQSWEDKAADGGRIVHGAPVWYRDRKGRVRRGRAFYKGGTQWMIRENDKVLAHVFTTEILGGRPADLRGKDNVKLRRRRLEGEMARAAGVGDFVRAQRLKEILFGAEDLWMIWATDKRAYYGPLYSGYVDDPRLAGKYTQAEAMKEVRRVPHELMAVAPDGTRIPAEVREAA